MSKGGALGRSFARFKCERCLLRFRSKKALHTHIEVKNHRLLKSLEDSKWVGEQPKIVRN